MGNASKRKPKRAPGVPREPGGAPLARPSPPRFAVVRGEYRGAVRRIDIYNLDHVVHVVAHVYGEERAIELWTLGDLAIDDTGRKPAPMTLTGKPAAEMLAHLILCGVDVEGAAEALARSRGDLYAGYFSPVTGDDAEPVELPEPGALGSPSQCADCSHNYDPEGCPGWIPGGLDDDCGAFERGEFEDENNDAGARFDEVGGGCACLTPPPPGPPISVEEHAAELRAMRQVEAAHNAARIAELDEALGPSPVLAGDVAGLLAERLAVDLAESDKKTAGLARKAAAAAAFDVAKAAAGAAAEKMHRPRTCADCARMTRPDCKPDKPNGICERFELDPRKVAAERVNFAKAARLVCPYGAKCERFPACSDCSLYALGERTTPADPHHVEEVTGEHRDVLAERVGRCGVFVGMQARGVEIGKQWCGVGHEMTDPACALCPYLRIASR
jgi:hypothetical protein